MNETNCKFCGDTVIIPENDEQIAGNAHETNMEHFRRTGHHQNHPDDYHNEVNE
jgi:hypothetical protein